MFRTICIWFGIIILVFMGIFGLSYVGWGFNNFFAPKYEQTRRDTFVHSRAFAEGNVHELYNLERQYEKASSESEKQTIKLMARNDFEKLPIDDVPSDMLSFREMVMN